MASSPEALPPQSLPEYAELHCVTNFTFLRGASHPDELVERAAELGYRALAITDECSLAGIVRAHVAAKERGLQLIVGAEFALADGVRLALLATDRASYGALSSLVSLGRRRSAKGRYALGRVDVEAVSRTGLLALLFTPEAAPWLARHFHGCAWIAAELLCGPDDRALLARLRAQSEASGLPLVAAGDVHQHVRSRRRLQDTLTAIRLRKPVAQCGHALQPSGERHLRLRARLAQLYPPELLAETVAVARRCRFSLDELRYEYPQEIVPPGETPTSHLRRLVEAGLARRFPAGADATVRGMVEGELALIADLGYEPFFLTVHDLVDFARQQKILCQGRGSAANSVVCYALGITAVAPEQMRMLFGRFLSPERNEPPDIDVDFEHQRREEVIQYLYRKYGRERAALAATVVRYSSRSALRDVGRALGLDAGMLGRISKAMAWWDRVDALPERLREAGFDPGEPLLGRLVELVGELVDFPRHLSQHVGGFVISRGPLAELVPIENAAMPGRTVIQWDKDDLEALRLLKVDVLALGMLSAIRRALALCGLEGMDAVPKEDPATYEMLSRADAVGVFQVESRAQMSMLPRLRPKAFYDLVIEVAIVRPGPIQGDMVHPYLRRRQGKERVSYPSRAVEDVLRRTLGVPIFQEQVMELAIVAAGFSPGEADQLRRSMAAWRRKGGLQAFESRLVHGMLARGYRREFAEAIYRQICGFGDYGFPEAHAASFALLVYVSAWLKRHRPAAFLVALLDSQPMGFYGPSQLVQDARRHGVEVRPVDVNESDWDCTLEPGARDGGVPGCGAVPTPGCGAVRLGLSRVGGLQEASGRRIAQGRPYASVEDLARRAALERRELSVLARAGALASLAGHRRNARWAAAGAGALPGVLASAKPPQPMPALEAPQEGDDLLDDYASLDLTLGRHPLALLRGQLARLRLQTAEHLSALAHGRPARAAGLVTCRQRPATATGIVFVTLEDETGTVNVVVWRDLVERQRRELLGASLMAVEGTIQREGEVVHLVARRLVDHSALLGRLATRSRDFH